MTDSITYKSKGNKRNAKKRKRERAFSERIKRKEENLNNKVLHPALLLNPSLVPGRKWR